jgi:flagellar biosynthetic protein FliQ
MTPEFAIQILRNALMTALVVSAPLLIIGLAAGVVMSLIQIVTSMQDTAFSTVPRLAVFLGGFLILLPWMFQQMISYTTVTLGDLGRYAR